MKDQILMDALDNALENIKIGNHEATGVSLDLAEKYMRNKDPVAFANLEKELDKIVSKFNLPPSS